MRNRIETLEDDLCALAVERERLHFALAGSDVGLWDWNCQTNEILIDERWAGMIGYRLEDLEMNLEMWERLIHPDDLEQVYADLQTHLSGATEFYENKHRLLTKSGDYRWILDRGKVFAWTKDGKPLRCCGTHRDVHKEKQDEEQLKEQALHDPLTNLANRRFLESMFRHAVAQAERSGSELGLIYVDLDGFKPINDSFGHDAGDVVLREVAKRLSDTTRGQDVVARVGGDEFCVLVMCAKGKHELIGLSRRIIRAISEPMVLNDTTAHLGCSIGVARYPYHGFTLEELLKAADTAMYAVKRAGKGDVAIAD